MMLKKDLNLMNEDMNMIAAVRHIKPFIGFHTTTAFRKIGP